MFKPTEYTHPLSAWYAIQGKASTWHDHLLLTASGTTLSSPGSMGGPSGTSGGSTAGNGSSKRAAVVTDARGRLEPGEVARIFEDRLAEALLGESYSSHQFTRSVYGLLQRSFRFTCSGVRV